MKNQTESQTKRILLAEDEEDIRMILAELLETEGYHVTMTQDGQEAFETLMNAEQPFDLIMSDVKMPRLSGDQFVHKVRTEYQGVQPAILLLTGGVGYDLGDESLPIADQIDGYIYKPFKMAQVLPAIRQVFDKKP